MSPEPARRATARDVAALADVSVATVSLVVNGKSAGRITPQTETRVRDAIRELDYRVNTTASSLARGSRSAVVFVSPDPVNPFFAELVESLRAALPNELSVSIYIPRAGGDYDRDEVQRVLWADLAAIVIMSPSPSLLETIVPTCPIVILDSGQTRPGTVSIDLELDAAARELADHLVDLGHRRLAYVGLGRDKATLQLRRQSLRDQLSMRGADFVVDDLVLERASADDARAAADAVLAGWIDDGVTAVVCGDDLLAYGVMGAARAQGIDIPGRLSVTGFNDLPYSAMLTPALTTVEIDARALGVAAAAAIRQLIGGGRPPGNTVLPTRVITRDSTADAP